ncbi:carbohydrate kinase family protein [Halopiger aswanensis]|uniref:Sugar/nucleoside kinase (Ribokinase family) n=1 Tax=Halopiger aswanensis TaxID=148449 RepID=A0A3R7HIM1_9EURY|nr:PfkB family carbohydrate kinase [Halopiger aswanensis]RKD95263.1 sugar/nucleoside kinase (ribokinase family) [Halopiger aswanensis]
MSYDDVLTRLERLTSGGANDPQTIVALPDGSVDHWYAVVGEGGERLESPAAFARQLESGLETVSLEPLEVRPGGQAVNAALQAHALGEDVTLVGHLDHPVFDELPFDARSMGSPAHIRVLAFDGDDVLLAEPGPTAEWRLEDLLAVIEWERLTGADALCCPNWVSVRGLTAVFERLGSSTIDHRLPVVVDPGALETVEPSALADFFDALSQADSGDADPSADSGVELVISVNPTEFEAAAAVALEDGAAQPASESAPEPTPERVESLRSALAVSGVVSHGSAAAVGATRSDAVSVPMLEIESPRTSTGAGDRFSGGLASALAREWPFETALALGNACAAAFVESAATADPAALRSFVREHGIGRDDGGP